MTAASAEFGLSFEPGSRIRYSNAGYNLAGAIIEAATGQDYHAYLRTEFFEPLGMDDTGFDDGSVETAMGYAWLAGGRTPQPESNASIVYAAGGLYSTADDLLAWNRALHGGRLLSAESYRVMTSPHNPPGDEGPPGRPPRGWGYGLFMADLGARMEPGFLAGQIYHTGSWAGFRALTTYHPAQDVTVVALSNYYHQRDALFVITQQAIAEVIGAPLPDRIAPN
ncbi:serine hydrolase domain-containing protein [Brevundimonas denitrificans]|uniref:serine hydrolase domain-containing protein n=1 Tax=Brevundimonas denitrificans TaxID=1443434 RepID=UPI00223B2C9A|nr:serine hydrolase domain-containing protein [Brevundimonas denitrificans]